jgi:hypothetical protein
MFTGPVGTPKDVQRKRAAGAMVNCGIKPVEVIAGPSAHKVPLMIIYTGQ